MPDEPWRQFDCYKTLNISSTATPDEIRVAYRKTSLKTHPDSGGSHNAQIRVNLAYEILSDPISRQAHDFYWYKPSIRTKPADRPADQTAGDTRSASHRSAGATAGARQGPTRSTGAGLASSLESLFRRVQMRMEEETERLRAKRGEAIKTKVSAYQEQFQRGENSRAWRFGVSAALTFFALGNPGKFAALVWLAAICAWVAFGLVARGLWIKSEFIAYSDPQRKEKIQSIAVGEVDAAIHQQEARLRDYAGKVGALGEIVSRLSSFDDSEEQVARRITVALFLMGYCPDHYDRQGRILVFTSGDERILVRFRHRTGIATNVSYVERMVAAMRMHRCSRGFLFCTPGLSGNGVLLARKEGITWYSLKAMNEWIANVLHGQYSGPHGDVFVLLDKVMVFLGQISTPLPYRGGRRRY